MRAASNPVGIGLQWVKNRFYDNPNENRIFIPAWFTDNKHIDQESYLESLKELPEALQKKLIEGDWSAIMGAAFPEFSAEEHVIDPIGVRGTEMEGWRKWEAMDWGTSNPTAWYAAILSPNGDTIVHGEYYAPGLITRHAEVINTLRHNHWGQPLMAVCDPSIKAKTGFGTHGIGESVHSKFAESGIYLVSANNDRIAGRVQISELLRKDPSHVYPEWHPKAGQYGAPRLYITANCKNLIEQLQIAPMSETDMETVDPFWETRSGHAVAALRYLVTARINPKRPEDPVQPGGRRVREWQKWNNWSEVG
jgi:hypothetical protein